MSQARTTKHTVPTHMNVPDKVLTMGSVSLSARQFLILLIGSSMGYNLWHQLHALSLYVPPLGVALRLCLALLPALLALVCALAQVAGRPLEVWCFVLLRYCWQPKRVVWRSVRCALREGSERLHEVQLEPDLADVPGEAEAEAGHNEACRRASENGRN
jgi:hypothetical protein